MTEDYSPIGFLFEPLIGVILLNESKPKFILEKFEENSFIYSRINCMGKAGFNYAYMNNILVIEDTAVKRHNFDCMLEDLHMSTKGDFIAFFNAERKSNVLLAGSLTFLDMNYLRKNLIANNLDIIL